MKKILVPLLILFILVCALSPLLCFRKSVMHSPADMIINAEVVDVDGVKYMLSYDAVFQATSKGSDGGSIEIHGSYDARLSVYSIESGKLVARKSIGKYYNRKQSVYLGYAHGYAWFYSCQSKKKLYAIDIFNTTEILSFDQIVSKNLAFVQKFAEPEWNQASQFFGFDKMNKRVLLTDMMGVQYGLDTKTLIIHRLDKEYHIGPVSNDPLCTSSKSRFGYISTEGSVRQTIIFNQRQTSSSLSFLDCNFIRDVNPYRTDELLSPDSTSFFVVHKSSISKKSLLAIARVFVDDSLNIKLQWSTGIPSIYFDPDEANQKNGLAEVFSRGNPEYDFKQFECVDNKLIVIYMLHLFAIDITTGHLEWLQPL